MGSLRSATFIYDGECGFCKRWVRRWQARTDQVAEIIPFQKQGALRRFNIPRKEAEQASQWIERSEEGGVRRLQGASAVLRLLSHSRGPSRFIYRVALIPGIRQAAEWVYRRIARHRTLAAWVDWALWGNSVAPTRTRLVRWLFTRSMGLVYYSAFRSLRSQVLGLYGSRGILPIQEDLEAIRKSVPDVPQRKLFAAMPSVFWFAPRASFDRWLVNTCRAGEMLGILLMLGIAPKLTSAALWMLYLSFVATGREFLSFQWDILLLESGLYTILAAPGGLRSSLNKDSSAPWPAVMLLRFLAFKLHFESGLCKLQSGDPTWRDRSACSYHFQTQPLPTALGWRAHQLSEKTKKRITTATLVLEAGVPFLAFLTPRPRRISFALLSFLQLAIAATGNYGFFNLLTLVDCLWLADDEYLLRLLRRAGLHPSGMRAEDARPAPLWAQAASLVATSPWLALGLLELLGRFDRLTGAVAKASSRKAIERLHEFSSRTYSVNPYGLFAVMTTRRPEIVIEGSNDGKEWREYEFRYKPGDPRKRPRFIAPHQPRLDWQMWFAAMQRPPRWFLRLIQRIFEGSPEVLELLEKNPFPEKPPKQLRASYYEYHATDARTRRRSGEWWRRERLGHYLPPSRFVSRRKAA